MEAANQLSTPIEIENEAFWQRHHQLQQASGLTRAAYCRQHQLNYDRFGYWASKWLARRPQGTGLVAVKLKPTQEEKTAETLCTVSLKGGHCLKLHDLRALAVVLEKMA